MAKYTFIMEDNEHNFMGAESNKVEYNIVTANDVTHMDLSYHFRQFLEGCGYVFSDDYTIEL